MFMQEQKFRGNSVYTLEYYERTLKMFLDFCSPDMDIEDLDIMILNHTNYIYLKVEKLIKYQSEHMQEPLKSFIVGYILKNT